MNFTDNIQVQAKVYAVGYMEIGRRFFTMNDDGSPNLADEIEPFGNGYDEDGNPKTENASRWLQFGKCIITPNSNAQKITLNDGSIYQYSYLVYAPLKKAIYPLIPRDGDKVWITKQDGTIDQQCEVKGFVTLKKRYVKIWV